MATMIGTPIPKPSVKRERITRELRRRIVIGQWGPGSRIPTRRQIEQRFGASVVTVQRALDRLSKDGFIRARGRHGTFVAPNPPHLRNVALVFPFQLSTNKYFAALHAAAQAVAGRDRVHFLEYYIEQLVSDHKDSRQFYRDARDHRFGGMIFAFPPNTAAECAILADSNMPCVVLSTLLSSSRMPAINMDGDAFLARAVAHLRGLGCRRIAHIFADDESTHPDQLAPRLHALGEDPPNHFIQPVAGNANYRSASYQALLLMKLAPRERPDGLVIHDDHITDHAIRGLTEAGARVGRDIRVVSWSNFPIAATCAVPVTYLGFDARVFLREALKLLDLQRQGRRCTQHTLLAPVFEHELSVPAGVETPV